VGCNADSDKDDNNVRYILILAASAYQLDLDFFVHKARLQSSELQLISQGMTHTAQCYEPRCVHSCCVFSSRSMLNTEQCMHAFMLSFNFSFIRFAIQCLFFGVDYTRSCRPFGCLYTVFIVFMCLLCSCVYGVYCAHVFAWYY